MDHRGVAPRRWRWGALIAAVVSVFSLMVASPASAQPPLPWSAPVLVDREVPVAALFGLGEFYCPSVSLCVVIDSLGNVLTSTSPALVTSWRVAKLRGVSRWGGLSCPSVSLCVGVGQRTVSILRSGPSYVLSSMDPAGGAARRRVARLDDASGLPTGGASAWRVVHVDNAKPSALWSVSCPSVSLCVGRRRWRRAQLNEPDRGCVGVDARAHRDGGPGGRLVSVGVLMRRRRWGSAITSSTDPTGGGSAWNVSCLHFPLRNPRLAFFDAVSCAWVSLFAAGGINGYAAITTNPTGGSGGWLVARVDDTNSLTAISCPSVSLCVVVDWAGNVLIAAPSAPQDPGGAQGSRRAQSRRL